MNTKGTCVLEVEHPRLVKKNQIRCFFFEDVDLATWSMFNLASQTRMFKRRVFMLSVFVVGLRSSCVVVVVVVDVSGVSKKQLIAVILGNAMQIVLLLWFPFWPWCCCCLCYCWDLLTLCKNVSSAWAKQGWMFSCLFCFKMGLLGNETTWLFLSTWGFGHCQQCQAPAAIASFNLCLGLSTSCVYLNLSACTWSKLQPLVEQFANHISTHHGPIHVKFWGYNAACADEQTSSSLKPLGNGTMMSEKLERTHHMTIMAGGGTGEHDSQKTTYRLGRCVQSNWRCWRLGSPAKNQLEFLFFVGGRQLQVANWKIQNWTCKTRDREREREERHTTTEENQSKCSREHDEFR